MPEVTIDGEEIEVPTGATVLQACKLAGKESPRFCHRERLRSGDAAAWSIQGLIRHFRAELERRIEEHNAQFAEAAK